MSLAFKSILTFDGIISRIKEIGSTFKDKRRGKNIQYDMHDIVLSAFSVFYLQCPSFLSYQETMESEQGDNNGRTLFNAFITDHKIHSDNVAAIVEDGRARWKTENENNNTLKKHGYNLEHNFGHGDKNLSNVLVTLNLIAFLCHTVLAMTSEAYQKIRKKLGARKKFFEHIRTLTHYILFDSWESLLRFMMNKLKLSFDTT